MKTNYKLKTVRKTKDNELLKLYNKLKIAEEQIKNGEVIEADIVFKEMRDKYGTI